MAKDDLVYAVVLVGSVFCGGLVSLMRSPGQKRLVCGAVGATSVAVICGVNGLHSLLMAIVNGFIVARMSSRICHLFSFVWCFAYLGFFRTAEYFGLPPISPLDNALQLFFTLRLVGLAFEVHDSAANLERLKKDGLTMEERNEVRLKCKYENVDPSLLDTLFYCYSYIGLYTGPYYKYRTYHDMLHTNGPGNNNLKIRTNVWNILTSKLRFLPIYVIVHVVLSRYVSVQTAKTEEFLVSEPMWFRAVYTIPMFISFRFRLFIAFILSECACVTAQLGAYSVTSKSRPGQGPTNHSALEGRESSLGDCGAVDNEVDFETIRNLDVWECEFAPTMRETIKSWNKTVQFWLAANVYRRLSTRNQYYKTLITMSVSAFWHGVHPGYYLTFLAVPFYLAAEDLLLGALERWRGIKLSEDRGIWRWTCWLVRGRAFEYMGIGFHFLGFQETIRYWNRLYFAGHIFIVVAIMVGVLLRGGARGKSKVR